MSAEAAVLVRSWPVGGYTVTLTAPKRRPGQVMHVAIEWSPAMPEKLDAAAWDQYIAGRDQAIADWLTDAGEQSA